MNNELSIRRKLWLSGVEIHNKSRENYHWNQNQSTKNRHEHCLWWDIRIKDYKRHIKRSLTACNLHKHVLMQMRIVIIIQCVYCSWIGHEVFEHAKHKCVSMNFNCRSKFCRIFHRIVLWVLQSLSAENKDNFYSKQNRSIKMLLYCIFFEYVELLFLMNVKKTIDKNNDNTNKWLSKSKWFFFFFFFSFNLMKIMMIK